MKYYQLFVVFLLATVFVFGRFLLSPQKLFYDLSGSEIPKAVLPKVKIYSTYPFNDRKEVAISAGSEQGIKEMMPVTVDGRILLGQVVKVFENYSIVRTIFDSGWQLPVRVGPGEVDALLEGGLNPRLTMVEKNKEFSEGQSVYAATRGFPYGLPLGKVKNVKDESTEVFKEAELFLPYNLNDLKELEVLMK